MGKKDATSKTTKTQLVENTNLFVLILDAHKARIFSVLRRETYRLSIDDKIEFFQVIFFK